MDTVKGLFEVNEINEKWCVPFNALLDDVPQSENLVNASSASSKACLFFSKLFIYNFINSFLEEFCKRPY